MLDSTEAVATMRKALRFSAGGWGLPLVILSIMIVTAWVEPRFWSFANFQNLLRQMAVLQILAAGQLFAVLSGGLDLSIAATMALAAVCGVSVLPFTGLAGGLTAMLVVGSLVGVLNGCFVVLFKVSPLIVTLGMMSIAKGLALLLAGGIPLYGVPESLTALVGFG